MSDYVFIIDIKTGPNDLFNINLEKETLEYFPGKTFRIHVCIGKIYSWEEPTGEEIDAMSDDEYMSYCVARLKLYETYSPTSCLKHLYPCRKTPEQRQAQREREREREPQLREERRRDREEERRICREAGLEPDDFYI